MSDQGHARADARVCEPIDHRADLEDLVVSKKPNRPKGAGRPKGKRNQAAMPKTDAVREALRTTVEAGKPIDRKKWADELDVSVGTVQRAEMQERSRLEALADPEIDRSALSLTAQQKFDAAVRQHQRKLDAAFESRVQEEINQRLDHIILPVWRKKIAEAKKIYDVRRSITNKETFNLIVRCLHTDTRRHVGDDVSTMHRQVHGIEKYLLNEKASPTKFTGLPTTAAEWEQAKQAAAAIRRAKRGHSNVAHA
jgi:hypothetical protein